MQQRRRPSFAAHWRPVAAACLLILLSSVLLVQNLPSAQQVYQQAYTPYKIHIMRSEAPARLHTYYAQGEYETFLQAYAKLETPSAHEQMMAGNAYLLQGNAQKAIENFETLQVRNDRELAEVAQWYQAMAYLELQQPQKAYPLLKQIRQQPNHLFHKQASLWLMLKVKASQLKN